MDYMLNKHLVNSSGDKLKKRASQGRSGRILMTNEARVLRELRLQSGLSMRNAGKLLGCTDSFISHIENGRCDVPTGIRLDKFLSVYGGIKQKSFYERVRRYTETIDPKQELRSLLDLIPEEKIKTVLQVLKSFTAE